MIQINEPKLKFPWWCHNTTWRISVTQEVGFFTSGRKDLVQKY